jgi:formylglycine-generating enzyme required for sulfatase activity
MQKLLFLGLTLTSFSIFAQKESVSPANTSKFENIMETVNGVNFNLVAIKGGSFAMGCQADENNKCDADERIVHPVTVSDFYLAQTEVTQALWTAVMGRNPSKLRGCDDCPVEHISWLDAQEFIEKLNKITGKNYRFPTEAEWEYAAKGGGVSQKYKYCGSNKLDDVAWYLDNNQNRTHPVGKKKPNELGLYDMSGNVYEWCQDWYQDSYPTEEQIDPKGPSDGILKVSRGGSWGYTSRLCRPTFRHFNLPTDQNDDIGLRLALSPIVPE